MRLTDKAIQAMTTRCKTRIALELDCSPRTVDRWISENQDDGDLTKVSAVKIIAEETGLDQSEVLEEATTAAA